MDLFATLVIGILAGVIANLMTEYIIHHWQHSHPCVPLT